MSDSLWPHQLYSPWNSPGQKTGVGSLSLPKGYSKSRDQTQVSCIAGRLFTSWSTREPIDKLRTKYQGHCPLLILFCDVCRFFHLQLFLWTTPSTTKSFIFPDCYRREKRGVKNNITFCSGHGLPFLSTEAFKVQWLLNFISTSDFPSFLIRKATFSSLPNHFIWIWPPASLLLIFFKVLCFETK